MSDYYLLENSETDGYLLEDSSGVLLLETANHSITFGRQTNVDKDDSVLLTNHFLTFNHANGTNYRIGARVNANPQAAIVQAEVRVDNLSDGGVIIGVEDGRWKFEGGGQLPHSSDGTVYGGIGLTYGLGEFRIDANNVRVDADAIPAPETGDIVSVVINQTAGTVAFYRTRAGVTIPLGTATGVYSWASTTGNARLFVGGTTNYATATIKLTDGQARPFDSGVVAYDAGRSGPWKPFHAATPLAVHFEVGPTTCFTSNNGTPVDGSTILSIRDSTTNLVLTDQDTTPATIYRTGNGKPYLEFSGGALFGNTAVKGIVDLNGQLSLLAAFRSDSPSTANQQPISFTPGTTTALLDINGSAIRARSQSEGVAGETTDTGPSVTSGANVVASTIITTTSVEAFLDGVSSGGATARSIPPITNAQSGTAINFVVGRVYGFLAYAGPISAADHTAAIAYMAGLYTASGGGTPITSTNISTSTPIITQSTVGIVYNFTSQNVVAPTPSISTSTITQKHVITSVNVVAPTPSISTSTITQKHALASINVANPTPVIQTTTITQKHAINSASLATPTPAITNATIAQKHALASNSIVTAAPSIALATVTQIHALQSSGIASPTPVVSVSTISEVSSTVNFVSQNIAAPTPVIATSTITQKHALVSQPVATASPAIALATIGQRHALASAPLAAPTPVVSASSLSQQHALASTALATASPVISAAVIAQAHALASLPVAIGTPNIQIVATTIKSNFASLSIAPNAPQIDITNIAGQGGLIALAVATSAPQITLSTITQKHALVSSNIATTMPVINSVSIGQNHALNSLPIATPTPTVGITATLITSNLSALSISSGTPVVSISSLAQGQGILSLSVTTPTPVISTSILGAKYNLISTLIVTPIPIISIVTFAQEYSFNSLNISTATPAISLPTIGQISNFVSLPIVTASPVIDLSEQGLAQVTVSLDIATASPSIGLSEVTNFYIPPATVPLNRIISAHYENRTLTIAAENRTIISHFENRILKG